MPHYFHPFPGRDVQIRPVVYPRVYIVTEHVFYMLGQKRQILGMAVDCFPAKNPVRILQGAIQSANAGIIAEAASHEELFGMGTTLVALTIIDGYAYVANVGDSRLYALEESLRQVTRDHSLVEEMVRLGEITEEDAKHHPDKNIITRALGTVPNLEIDFFDFRVPPDGQILMCSDGLSNMVDDQTISRILEEPLSVKEKVEKLIRTANDNGGRDNIAVIVVEPDMGEVM